MMFPNCAGQEDAHQHVHQKHLEQEPRNEERLHGIGLVNLAFELDLEGGAKDA